MSEYKETELGLIPNEWKLIELGNHVDIKSGQSPTKFDICKDGLYPFFKVNDMNYSKKYLITSKESFNNENIKLFKKGMVVFPKRGASIFTNKINILGVDAYFDTNIMGLICHRELKNQYLFYSLMYRGLSKLADTTSIPQINNKHIIPFKIALPPLPEQKKTILILSAMDNHIDEVEGMIEDLKELKKGLMQKLLTEGIGHTEFKDSPVGRIPAEWEVKKLGEIFNLSSGKFLSAKNMIEGSYNVFGGNGISGKHNEYLFNDRKILIGRVGAKCGCVHLTSEKSWITDNALYISDSKINFFEDYMIYLLKWLDLNKYANQNAQPVISGKKIYSIIVAFPSLKEQKKIAEILSSADERIEIYKTEKEDLKELKKGLMQQLLTGKTRVKVD